MDSYVVIQLFVPITSCYKRLTYHNLRDMIQNKDIVVVKGDKDSSINVTKNSEYIT